jgi:hypothetical protein
MFPRLVDCGFHIVGQDDELRRPAGIMRAETYNINLSHSGRKIARKPGESKSPAVLRKGRSYAKPARSAPWKYQEREELSFVFGTCAKNSRIDTEKKLNKSLSFFNILFGIRVALDVIIRPSGEASLCNNAEIRVVGASL